VQNGQKEKDGAPRLSYGVSSHVPSCKAKYYVSPRQPVYTYKALPVRDEGADTYHA